MTKLTELDCLANKKYPAKLRIPTLALTHSVVGFRYRETEKVIGEDGSEIWVTTESNILGRMIRAFAATTEEEARVAFPKQWYA